MEYPDLWDNYKIITCTYENIKKEDKERNRKCFEAVITENFPPVRHKDIYPGGSENSKQEKYQMTTPIPSIFKNKTREIKYFFKISKEARGGKPLDSYRVADI